MDWQTQMNRAIDYIEANLDGEIRPQETAKFLHCSVWEFGRLFSFVAHTSFGEYIRKRKLTLAAIELQTGDEKIIDIAVKYGYDSPAAFSRAFARQYGISPSAARAGGAKLTPYPKITFQIDNEERTTSMKTKNDLQTYGERGYYVKENAPLYFTPDMERPAPGFAMSWAGTAISWAEMRTAVRNTAACSIIRAN